MADVAEQPIEGLLDEPPDAPRYLNRELSWLDFNERVLALGRRRAVPLLERAKFLAIFSQNLDEFFQVRVAGLKEQVAAGLGATSPDGRTPGQQLLEVRERVEAPRRAPAAALPRRGRARRWPPTASASRAGTSSTTTTRSSWSRRSSSGSSRCSPRWPSTPATRSRTSRTCR